MSMPFLDMLMDGEVRFVVIGGQAMRHHAMPRFTMDWDICIPPKDERNLERLNKVMAQLDEIPVEPLGPKGQNFVQTYQTPWGVVQFHLCPIGMPEFDEIEECGETDESGVKYACAKHLLAAKEAVNRPNDQMDIVFLKKKLGVGSEERQKD